MPSGLLALPMFLALGLSTLAPVDDQWIVYEGGDGPGQGKKVVLIAADDEYRSEELIPALAKILAERHGFTCQVLFAIDPETGAIDPDQKANIPGIEALDDADLLVLFARFRALPPESMKHFVDYVESGRPIVALRTSTHAFNYPDPSAPYAELTWNSKDPAGGFGRKVLGETWVAHHGEHQVESTRGIPAPGQEDHPILRGVADVWGPSDVYAVRDLPGDSTPILLGQVLEGMDPTDPVVEAKGTTPIAWTRTYTGSAGKPSRVFVTTMGHAGDFANEGVRRFLVNACFWGLGMEDQIRADANVDLVGPYDPRPIGVGGHAEGVRPADLKVEVGAGGH